MKKALSLFAVILTFTLAAAAQDVCKQRAATGAGFSFCLPEGWLAETDPGDKYPSYSSPAGAKARGNLNFKDVVSETALADFVTASNKYSLENLTKNDDVKSLKLLSRADFITAAKDKGEKLVYLMEYKEFTMRSLQFYFAGKGNRKIIMTFTSLDADKDVMEKFVDDTIKTVQLDK